MNREMNTLINNYYSWLKDKTSFREVNNYIEITTPYLDRHNDYIQIYAKKSSDKYILSDDGYTISDLTSSGCKIDTLKRKELLNIVLNGFGIKIDKDVLSVMADNTNFPSKKHNLIQAILTVNDLFFTAQPIVANLFIEDVTKWLDKNDIRYIPRLRLTGKTGFDYSFHFGIPKSKSKPERILQAINSPSKSSIENFILSWFDTRDARPVDSIAYTFLNDEVSDIKPDFIDALKKYDIRPVPWKNKSAVKDDLAA